MELINSSIKPSILEKFESMQFDSEGVLSYIVMIALSFIAIFATVANTTTIIIYSKRKLGTRYALIINLAIAELATPLLTYWMVISSSFNMSWVYGEIGERNCGTCQHKHIFFLLPLTFYTDIMLYVNDINLGCILYAFINGFCGMASIACLTLMAVERYITLCLSQNAKITFHRAQTKLIFGIWLYATIVSTPPLFGWGRYVQDVYPASCTFDFYTHDRNSQTFMIYLLTVGFLLPVIVMSTLYGRIHAKISSYKRLVKRARTSSGSIGWSKLRRFLPTISFRPYDRNLPGENLTLGQSNIDEAETSLNGEKTIDTRYLNDHWEVESRLERAEVQFCKRTLLVILGFLVCWTPYAMLTIACQLEFEAAFSTTASAVTLLLAKASVAINPIIYAFKDKMYRSELNNLIGSLSD